MNWKLGLALVPSVALGACATVIEGTTQSVTVVTDPPGATCQVERGGEVIAALATTPGSVTIDKSKNELLVTCTKDGHAKGVATQEPTFKATTAGNIIAGGLIGVAVDAASGANYEYPSPINVKLAPNAPAAPQPAAPPAAPKAQGKPTS